MKLVTYSVGDGRPRVGRIQDGEVHPLGGRSLLEYTERGRSAARQPDSKVVSRNEVPDPQDHSIRAILDGMAVQDGTMRKMIFSVDELVSFLSSGMTLELGDVILTGTPPGVGMGRDPHLWLKAGDKTNIEIGSLGILTKFIKAG